MVNAWFVFGFGFKLKIIKLWFGTQKPNYELIKISIGALDQPTLVWTTIEWVLKFSFGLVNYI
jgi:hypothetical protein